MDYHHTQKGGLHLILYPVVGGLLLVAWSVRGDPVAGVILLGSALVMLMLTFSCHHLTVSDERDCLAICYGPLPLFRKRIDYASITAVDADRSSVLDGWGIHYVPGRGWTYNLWGLDCVKLTLGRKVVRVGTDDVDNLVTFLRTKVGS